MSQSHPGTGFHRGRSLYERHLSDSARPDEFELLGRRWELLEGVFSPAYTPVTGLFSGWLDYPRRGAFLEMGSGAGVTSVVAALAGCPAVTALDISAAAVENTRRNARRHGVGDRVRVLRSDLFAALRPGDRFDLVFWNSSFAEPPAGFVNETDLHHAFFDPGYAAHRAYLAGAARHLSEHGRLTLGFSSLGNWPRLRAIADELGLEHEVIAAQERLLDGTLPVEFQLVGFRPRGGRPWSAPA